MKILYITGIPAPYRVDLFNQIGKQIELTVAFLGANQSGRDKEWQSETAKEFVSVYLSDSNLRGKKFDLAALNYIKNNHMKFDLIIMHGYSSISAMLAIFYMIHKKISFAIEADGGLIPEHENFMKKHLKMSIISKANAWLSSGKLTTEFLKYYGAKEEDIYEYPFTSLHDFEIVNPINAIDMNKKNALKETLGIKEEKIVLTVGQFIPRKGFDVLLNCCKDFSGIGVYFIGGEPTEEYLSIVKSLSLENVYFLPFMSKQKLKQYYQIADVFAFPTREDIWGLVINEALAMNVPVVSTNKCVAAVQMLPPECVVEVDDASGLSKKILEIMFDEDLKRRLVNYAFNVSLDYTLENSARRHTEIFDEICKKNK